MTSSLVGSEMCIRDSQRVFQRPSKSMPHVFENDNTVFANAAGRVQLREAPPAGQPETTQQHPF
eukprot:5048538-Prorocentrum_lima.AAC.1